MNPYSDLPNKYLEIYEWSKETGYGPPLALLYWYLLPINF